MDDAFVVSCLQTKADLCGHVDQSGQRLLEGLSLQQLHGDERLTFVRFDVVNRADVRMVEGRRGLRFPLQTLESDRVANELIWKEFQRNETAQLEILRLVNRRHATAAKHFENAVMADFFPGQVAQRGRFGWGDYLPCGSD